MDDALESIVNLRSQLGDSEKDKIQVLELKL